MSKLSSIKDFLQEQPEARKRSNRYKAIRFLVVKKYGAGNIENIQLTKTTLENIIYDSITYNRLIRRAQQLNCQLRDESNSENLETNFKRNLEYKNNY